ncbi:MAG: 3-hydroxyacyl-CoA dehydrogenase family protein, partial [Pseudonocardia sp.]|nr:3-hydroxyacyl-CoA dehydrogenase family protein [Pseudonocardia sp.]
FVANRLQEALWRESLHMVAAGEATVEQIDQSIVDGPGLRWPIQGPCLTFHLAGGQGGMAHMLDHFGPFTHPDVVADAVGQVTGTPDDGYAACCAALRDFDHRGRLGAITAPTLVIAGSADPATPIEPHARTIVDGIPGARLEVLDAAHLATIERSAQATDLIAVNSSA